MTGLGLRWSCHGPPAGAWPAGGAGRPCEAGLTAPALSGPQRPELSAGRHTPAGNAGRAGCAGAGPGPVAAPAGVAPATATPMISTVTPAHRAVLRPRTAFDAMYHRHWISKVYGFQCSLIGCVQPRAGVASRLTFIESVFCTGLTPWNWVMFSEQVSTANQNHWFGAPTRLTAISFQPAPDRWYPAAVTVAVGGWPAPRVAVSTTLNPDSSAAPICRCCGLALCWLAPAAPATATVASRPAPAASTPAAAIRRVTLRIMGTSLTPFAA